MINGYWDALLGVRTEGQLEKCGTFMAHATTSFTDVVNIFSQTNDFWMPLDKKFNLYKEGITKLIDIFG